MPTNLQITIDLGSTVADLDKIQHLMENLDIWLLDVGLLWSDEMQINFSKADWTPLAAATIARKIAGGYPLDPLIRTKAMMEAATNGEWSASKSGNEAIATLEVPGYAQFHIEGTQYMPARDFTYISSDMSSKLEESLWRFLSD